MLADPSPLGVGLPLSLMSPGHSPQHMSAVHTPPRQQPLAQVRWDAPSPEWSVLSPAAPRSFRG